MTWITRQIEVFLKSEAALRPAVVITGPRQAGKTTLCQKCFPEANYISLDLPLTAQEAEESGQTFLSCHQSPLILDEIQHAPGILPFIKHQIDKQRDTYGQFILTGSQSFKLMQGVSESLSGRISIIQMHSLSAFEFEKHSKEPFTRKLLLDWILTGGYPELRSRNLDSSKFYSDYVATYLERDIRQIVQVRDLRDFNRFLRLCAARTGQLISFSDLATDTGVSPNTIKSWISALEASYAIYLLPPYFGNIGKRLVKTPKLYFLDTGLACYLLGIQSIAALENSPLLGSLFETHALGQLLRNHWNAGKEPQLYFYRDHHGNEVDFVISAGERFHLYECKWNDAPKPSVKGFNEITKLVGDDNVISKSIVYAGRNRVDLKSGITLRSSIDLHPN